MNDETLLWIAFGCRYPDGEKIAGDGRMDRLVMRLGAAIKDRDFKKIDSALKAIRAECKRHNWQAQLTTTEARVVITHAVLKRANHRGAYYTANPARTSEGI